MSCLSTKQSAELLTFSETPPLEMDSDGDEEDFPTAELKDAVWSKESIPNRQQLCIH